MAEWAVDHLYTWTTAADKEGQQPVSLMALPHPRWRTPGSVTRDQCSSLTTQVQTPWHLTVLLRATGWRHNWKEESFYSVPSVRDPSPTVFQERIFYH